MSSESIASAYGHRSVAASPRAPRATNATIETEFLDRGQQGRNLEAIAADFTGRRNSNARFDGIFDFADDQFAAEFLRAPISEFVQFRKVMPGINVEKWHRDIRWTKGLFGQPQQAN